MNIYTYKSIRSAYLNMYIRMHICYEKQEVSVPALAHAQPAAGRSTHTRQLALRYSIYLYWYKSANTDAKRRCQRVRQSLSSGFTCFPGTKVQILTQKALAAASLALAFERLMHSDGTEFRAPSIYSLYWYKRTCSTRTPVQILTQKVM